MNARIVVGPIEVHVYAPFPVKETIKALSVRRWEPNLKCWVIPRYLLAQCEKDLIAAGCSVVLIDPHGNPWTPPVVNGTKQVSDWAGALLAAVGPKYHAKVFSALARVLHPDAGGDTQLMQDLNRARDRMENQP